MLVTSEEAVDAPPKERGRERNVDGVDGTMEFGSSGPEVLLWLPAGKEPVVPPVEMDGSLAAVSGDKATVVFRNPDAFFCSSEPLVVGTELPGRNTCFPLVLAGIIGSIWNQ